MASKNASHSSRFDKVPRNSKSIHFQFRYFNWPIGNPQLGFNHWIPDKRLQSEVIASGGLWSLDQLARVQFRAKGGLHTQCPMSEVPSCSKEKIIHFFLVKGENYLFCFFFFVKGENYPFVGMKSGGSRRLPPPPPITNKDGKIQSWIGLSIQSSHFPQTKFRDSAITYVWPVILTVPCIIRKCFLIFPKVHFFWVLQHRYIWLSFGRK